MKDSSSPFLRLLELEETLLFVVWYVFSNQLGGTGIPVHACTSRFGDGPLELPRVPVVLVCSMGLIITTVCTGRRSCCAIPIRLAAIRSRSEPKMIEA
jgi:hypothetical protein